MRDHARTALTGLRSPLAAALALSAAVTLPAADGGAGFAGREGADFICDGTAFPVVGFNCYYLMVYAAEPGLRRHVDEVLNEARTLGASVVRTWAFNDGAAEWNALQRTPGVYDERVFVGLDYVIHRARALGLKVLLTLVNNWDSYGGMDRYVEWSPAASSHDDFYTDPSCREWYRSHATTVLTRVNTFTGTAYRDEPAIFGWELANEPRCPVRGRAVLNTWIAEMAAHAKSIDPRHLLSTGSEGFYGPSSAGRNPAAWMANEGVDFIANHAHADVDFASFHTWPDLWGLESDLTASVRWIEFHLADARGVLGKPALMGEFGKMQPVATRDAWFRAFHDAVEATILPSHSSAGLLCWILYHDAYADYDGFGVYYPDQRHASTTDLLAQRHASLRRLLAAVPRFRRGDANCDVTVDISDPVATLFRLFGQGVESCCSDAEDTNDDGRRDISDAILTLAFIFTGGPPPRPPHDACGDDGGTGELPDLGCTAYPACE